MKRKRRIIGVLMIVTALIITLLPMSEADAATSASDFQIEGSTLVKYRGTEKNVSVPDTVEVIGRSAFENNKNIELVVLPNSVERIEPYAFWGCDNLDNVVLGKGLTEIGDYAFASCTGLRQMFIPSNVLSIGIQAFSDCVNMTDIKIPRETANIHETSFDGCYRLTIHSETGSAAEKYAEAFYERQKEMPEYEDTPGDKPSGDVVTPSPAPNPNETPNPAETPAPTQPPSEEAGNVLGATQVVANQAVVFVNNAQPQVYEGGENREESMPVEIQTMDELTGSIPKYTIVDGKVVADQAYYRDAGLGEMVLSEGIVEIGEFAFARSSVTSVVLPTGAEKICYGAFYHCDQLQNVTIPDTVMCVEPNAFSHTLWVENFMNGISADGAGSDFLTEGGVLLAYRGNSANVTVPEGVRVIAGEVFRDHREIESVSLPDSLLVVGEGAFEGCSSLGEISIGRNVEEVKDRAFLGNTMKEINLPSSIKKIGLQAFGNTVLVYGRGGEAEYTHETSASRLSNEAYRIFTRGNESAAGVTVTGLEETFGSMEGLKALADMSTLEGAGRSYILTVKAAEDTGAMEKAVDRSFRTALPENMKIYDLTLTDESDIPLTKLGRQTITIFLPVPEILKGQNLKLLMLDRNGQLEALTAERVMVNGAEAFYFQTNRVFQIGIYGTGEAEDGGEIMELQVEVSNLSAPPAEKEFGFGTFRPYLAGGLLLAGTFLLLGSIRKKSR